MKGYICKKCRTELLYEPAHGMEMKKQRENGSYYYSVYYPKCKEYFKKNT